MIVFLVVSLWYLMTKAKEGIEGDFRVQSVETISHLIVRDLILL